MFSDGVHRVPNLRDQMIDDWDVVGDPFVEAGSGRYRSAFVSAEAWMILATTPHPEEALRFVEFLLEPEQMIEFTRLGGIIPAQADTAREYFFGSQPPPQNVAAFVQSNRVLPPDASISSARRGRVEHDPKVKSPRWYGAKRPQRQRCR